MVKNMTEGNPIKEISLFAVPLFVGIVFQQVYNMVDSVVVGQFVGPVSLGAVGACGGTFNLIISLLSGLAGGSGVILAQYFGADNKELVKKGFIATCIVNIAAGILLTIIGLLVAESLIHLLGTPAKQVPEAVTYLTIMCGGIMANCLYNGMSAVLRAFGDSITPLVALIIASLLNIGLDLLFVIKLGMGVAGVAYATIIAQLVSAVVCIIYTMIKLPQLRFGIKNISFEKDIIWEIIRIGVPSALTTSGVSISTMFMQSAINKFGDVVVTGYTVGNKAEQIGLCLAVAIGMAVGTFCGQNIGARKFDRVKQGLRIGVISSLVYTVVMSVMVIIFAKQFCMIFTDDPHVIEVAREVIYVTTPFGPVLGLIFVIREFLKSAGDVAPTVWMSVTEIVSRSVLAFVFAGIWGYTGIWWVTPIGWIATIIIGFWRYKSGAWKRKIKI